MNAPTPVASELLSLAVAIAVAQRNPKAAEIPADLAPAYHRAIEVELRAAAVRLLDAPWDALTASTCLAAIAASKGQLKLADVLMDGQLCTCPECGELFSLDRATVEEDRGA